MAQALPIIITVLSAAALTAFQTQQQKKKLREAEKKARNRIDVMLRSATEAQRIIYGQRRVSGVLTYANVRLSTGTADNSDLWQVIALAGHEVNAITDLYLDGDKIPAASINGSGEVTGGKYAPISGRPTVQILKNLGSDTQSALSIGFADWTSNHRLRGVAHIATRFELSTRGSGGLWKNGAPSNVRVTVQGKKVYDPRLDSTAGGSGSHRLADPSTWEYSANPALCLADYLIDTRLGMGQEGITSDDIDYGMVATAADECDVTVSVPGGTEARYEINGVLFSTDSYEKNILDILSCMNGTMVWSNGQFRIRAGEYEAPVESFDEDDIIGSVSISAERGREERINKIRGTYANADQNYDLTQYIPVEDANLIANRDNGNELVETIDQPLVTSEYQAQRLAFKLIQINNQQLRATIPLNYRAMNVRVGDRIQVSVDALNWSSKVFRVEGWKFGVEDGFVLSVIEDSSTAYDDPDVADYSTRSAAGTITFADPPVPSPSNLTVTSQRNGILVEWDEPEPPVLYDEVQVFASPDSSWSNAVLVASTRGTTFFHDLDPGTERYYWARSIDNKDDLSDRDPDSDTSSVVATASAVAEDDVSGLPEDVGQNLIRDPRFTRTGEEGAFGTYWYVSGSGISLALTSGEDGGPAIRWDVTAGASLISVHRFPVRKGDVIWGRVRAFFSSGYAENAIFRLEMRLLDADGNGLPDFPDATPISSPPTGSWITRSGSVEITNADARFADVWITAAPSAGHILVDDVYLARAEDGADTTANNGQPPSWLTALIASSDIDAADIEAVLNALNLINAAAEAGADVTANNGQAASWLTTLIGSSEIDAADVEAVLDVLNLLNAPADAGATAGATWGTNVTGQPVDSGQNIVTDPRFTASAAAGGFGTWWTTVGPAPTIGATAAEDGGPAAVWGVTAGSSIVAALRFPIRDGDVIFGRVRAFFSSAYASAADFRLELRLLDKDGGDLSAYPNVVTISSPTLNAWDTYSGTLTVNNASARYAEIWVTGGPTAGLVYVDDVYIARAEDGADTTANNPQAATWLTTLIASSELDTADVEAALNALNLINAPAESGADVTSNNGQPPSWLTALIDSGDIDAASVEAVLDALNLINPPAEAGASRGVIDAVSANTDGNRTVTDSVNWTTVQTQSITLSESTTVALTISAMISAQSVSDGDYFCKVRVMQDSTELGGLSSLDFGIPGVVRMFPFVYRRLLTLSAGTYVFDFDVKKAGTVNANVRARVITIEEIR